MNLLLGNKLFIIGMPGVGKTTVAERLAVELGFKSIDVDTLIQRSEHTSIAKIFEGFGENYFREIETKMIAVVASDSDSAVIALGGGAVMRDENIQIIKEAGLVIWLNSTLDTLQSRLDNDGTTIRPLLAGDVREKLIVLQSERTEIYRMMSDLRVDVDGKTVDDVVDEIVEFVNEPKSSSDNT